VFVAAGQGQALVEQVAGGSRIPTHAQFTVPDTHTHTRSLINHQHTHTHTPTNLDVVAWPARIKGDAELVARLEQRRDCAAREVAALRDGRVLANVAHVEAPVCG
jgi:hypothetical protein